MRTLIFSNHRWTQILFIAEGRTTNDQCPMTNDDWTVCGQVQMVYSFQAEDFIRLVHDGLAVGIAQGKFGIAQF